MKFKGGDLRFFSDALPDSFFDIQNGIRGIHQGQCDTTYALNNSIMSGFHGVDNAICTLGYQNQQAISGLSAQLAQCCCDTRGAINEVGTGVERAGWNLSKQISDCCCTTQRAIDGVNFNMAKGFCDLGNVIHSTTRDVIDNQNANARAILDALTAQRIADKDERIAQQNQKIFALELAASQANQSAVLQAAMDANKAEILRRTGAECPTPAYLVNAPTPVSFPLNACGQVQFSNNYGGCGNCSGF